MSSWKDPFKRRWCASILLGAARVRLIPATRGFWCSEVLECRGAAPQRIGLNESQVDRSEAHRAVAPIGLVGQEGLTKLGPPVASYGLFILLMMSMIRGRSIVATGGGLIRWGGEFRGHLRRPIGRVGRPWRRLRWRVRRPRGRAMSDARRRKAGASGTSRCGLRRWVHENRRLHGGIVRCCRRR